MTFKRTAIYLAGVICVSLGIVFCKKCGLGISPISSIPFVLEDILPLTFGTLTMLFHFVNTALQLLLTPLLPGFQEWKSGEKRAAFSKIILQVLLAALFAVVIDFFNGMIRIDSSLMIWKIISLALSVVLTAFGMLLMLDADLIQNPPDGTVKLLAGLKGIKVGTMKVIYDWSCVAVSVVIGFVFLHKLKGLGIATVVSALAVGRMLSWMQKISEKIRG